MYYSGYFRNTDTSIDEAGQLFKVVIITNFKKEEFDYGGELMLSDSPFVVNYESEDGNIYKPYKCSAATVGILQKEYNFEFSNTSGNNVLVMLLRFKNGKNEEEVKDSEINSSYNRQLQIDNICYNVEWIGYATPNTYSQSFEDFYDEFELEAQDAISTLQYLPYKMRDLQNTYISFIDIIKAFCTSTRAYKNIYISDTLRLPTDEDGDILNFCYIDQRNFFDEDEVAKKQLEVLEQVCKYLNLTLIPYGDSLYIVDYNGISKGYNSYYHYKYELGDYYFDCEKVSTSLNVDFYLLKDGKVKFEDKCDIKEDDFSSTGTKLSLLSTYNKLSVKDSLYSYDSISPDFEETERWTNSLIYDQVGYYDDVNIVIESGGEYASEIENASIDIAKWCDGGYTPHRRADEDKYLTVIGNKRNGLQKVYIKFLEFKKSDSIFNNSELKTYWYYNDTEGINDWSKGKELFFINNSRSFSYNNMRKYTGAQFIAYQTVKVEENNKSLHPLKLELKPAILISTPSDMTFNDAKQAQINDPDKLMFNQPMFKIKSKSTCLGSGDYIVISFTMKCYKERDCLPIDVNSSDNVDIGTCQFIGITLNGKDYFVDNADGTFSEPYYFENNKQKKAFGEELELSDIKNRYNFKDKLGVEKGIVIPARLAKTENGVQVGDIEVTFFRPFGGSNNIPVRCTLIEDFKIEIVTKSDINSINCVNDNTDTEYSNIIDEESVEEETSIDLDISTWDNKQPNYSSVIYSEKLNVAGNNIFGKDLARVRHIYNRATGNILRAEEQIIYNFVEQYSTPTVSLNLNLHKLPLPYSLFTYHYFKDKLFIVDGSEYDYRNNSYNINLTEKK